ncbi:envelope stress response membrane protein PspC [Catenovulum sediminis]|uniref:Envelope stress response membrane protein PspC n=1 Tax=Catenovulum sediminis TaxID=1740262 RepID=A0ABV1RDK8_9ALTE|nr:envelope stress response membrane protein PspC [Catenovulum sediminis]
MKNVTNKLMRDMQNRRIAGVCAGFARYFGLENWVVRIVTVGALFFSFSLIFFAYVAAWLILERDDEMFNSGKNNSQTFDTKTDDNYHFDIKANAWQAGQPPKHALNSISKAFERLESRIQAIEKYATSERFRVEREINRL